MSWQDIKNRIKRNSCLHHVVLTILRPYIVLRKWLIEDQVQYIIVSFPKSGRTWVRVFLSEYVHVAYGVPHTLDFAFFRRVAPNFPRVRFRHGGNEETIDALRAYIQTFQGRDVLLLVRDPRDVVVSYYYETTKRDPRYRGSTSWTMSEFIRDKQHGIEHIISFMNLWYEARTDFCSLTIVRYRDLRNDPNTHFRTFLEFLGLDHVNEKAYTQAIKFSAFDNMRKLEEQDFFTDPRVRAVAKQDVSTYKTRKGEVGGYKKTVSEKDIQYMNDGMKKLDPAFGYSPC